MSIKKARKMGFWAAISMLIGSVVGIGIFFKNGSISRITDQNGATWLAAWIVGGILALGLAISFSEIGTTKMESKTEGIAKWATFVGGKKMGYFSQFTYSFFYTGFFTFVLGFFASEATFQGMVIAGWMKSDAIPIWGHALFGLFITAFLIFVNVTSVKASGIFQQITVVLKFIPLIAAIIIGVGMATSHHYSDVRNPLHGSNGFTHGQFNPVLIIAALPAVLFAYDGFLNVATMQKKVKNGEKQIPKILFIGMLIVIIVNSLISLASILHTAPSVDIILKDVFGNPVAQKTLGIIVYMFIAISAWGVVNGYSAGYWAAIEQGIETNLFFGMRWMKEKLGIFKTTLIYAAGIITFWASILLIPSIILNTDSLIDSLSNWPTFFIFGLLATIILIYTIKRKHLNTTKMHPIVFWTASVIAVAGIFGSLIFSLIYSTIYIDLIKNPNQTSSYGLFEPGEGVKNYIGSIMFFVQLAIFITFPIFNKLLKKRFEKTKTIETTPKTNLKK
ncbi:APC family permease [Mycoplasma todarodis]|uniref:APC family permease n=1 Tax=Mycoplasma todarodis TaxID=1937191 RepID=UPI003B2CDF49